MRLRGTQHERMSFMCMGSVWEVHSRNMYGFCMWDQFIDWSHTHKQQEHVWFMCVGSVCLRDLYTAGMCMVYVCGLWDQFIWEVHSKNMCGSCVWDQFIWVHSRNIWWCVVYVCGISLHEKYTAGTCVVYVCGISLYEKYTAGTCTVWFICVGSVCMRSTQQEHVWFMRRARCTCTTGWPISTRTTVATCGPVTTTSCMATCCHRVTSTTTATPTNRAPAMDQVLVMPLVGLLPTAFSMVRLDRLPPTVLGQNR